MKPKYYPRSSPWSKKRGVSSRRRKPSVRNTSTANSLTEATVRYLTAKGFKVWRQNNIGIPGKTFTGLRGIPDVIGFNKRYPNYPKGIFIGVEIKIGRDKMSMWQEDFRDHANEGGALYIELRHIDELIKLFP